MKERGELPDEEGGAVREYVAMHEENFWSSWLSEDERGKEKRMAKAEKNEEEKGEKRRDPLEKHEDLSDCEPDSCAHVRVVPGVTDVLVSPSSVVTVFCDVLSLGSDWEDVVPQSFSPKSVHFVVQVHKKR